MLSHLVSESQIQTKKITARGWLAGVLIHGKSSVITHFLEIPVDLALKVISEVYFSLVEYSKKTENC